jgi:DNA-directed RNA polymerase sigma subunit (sigma70/sigma32)
MNLVKDNVCNFKFYYDDVELLNSLLEKLNDTEKNLIKLRFFDRKTLQELSDINGFTKQWNRIKILQILNKMNEWCR